MIRAFQNTNNQLYKDFENDIFENPLDIVFDTINDRFNIGGIWYSLSTIVQFEGEFPVPTGSVMREITNAEMNAMPAPPPYEIFFNTDISKAVYHNGSKWGVIAGFPKPMIKDIDISRLEVGVPTTVTITGSYFTDEVGISVENTAAFSTGLVYFVDAHTVKFTITATGNVREETDLFLLDRGGNDIEEGAFTIIPKKWNDLRAGNNYTHGNAAGNEIRYRNGMNLQQDAVGMWFSGASPWAAWVKFENSSWTRGMGKTCEWILNVQNSSAFMVGIGSSAGDENSFSQYAQLEVAAYFSQAFRLWGIYGSSGTLGSGSGKSSGYSFNATGIIKISFTMDGGSLGTMSVYQLPSANQVDWNDTSNLILSVPIAGINPAQQNLMPFIIPQNGGNLRFIAVTTQL